MADPSCTGFGTALRCGVRANLRNYRAKLLTVIRASRFENHGMRSRRAQPLTPDGLFECATAMLARRGHSLGELREKLRRRCTVLADVDEVIRRLKEIGYLDDRSYAENFASRRLENEGHGKMRVLRDLSQRRVAPKLAEQAVEKAFADTDEVQLIENFLARKFRGKDLPAFLAVEKNLVAAFRRLRYAGFSAGKALFVLKRYSRRADELEDLE
jgi:regulatory protein